MLLSLSLALTAVLRQQQPADSSFWRARDGRLVLGAVAATAVTAVFDERIARWARTSSVQGDSSRHDAVEAVTVINEMPLTLAAVATYGVGRLSGQHTVADIGAHWTEALLSTVAIDEVLRIAIGRARPRASPDDAFAFKPGQGLSQFEFRSFPSLHAAVAFATAAALSQEMEVRKTRSRRVLTWTLFTLATIPGFTRLYLDQHWASDIVSGSAVGAYLGTRVVQYMHGHATRLDRVLLGARVVPTTNGMVLGWTVLR